MKIELGRFKIDIAAWLAVLAVTAIIITAVIFACANFKSLELSGTFKLTARDLSPSTINQQPSTGKADVR